MGAKARTRWITLFCVLSLLIFNASGQAHAQKKPIYAKKAPAYTGKGLTYTNKEMGFSLVLPGSWEGKYYVSEVEQISVNFYEKKSHGLLFAIVLIDLKEWNDYIDEFEDMPYQKIGVRHGKVYTYMVACDAPVDDGFGWTKMMGEIDRVIKTFRFID